MSELQPIGTRHPSEAAGHFYDRTGQQVPFTTGAKGQQVKTTLAHARKLQLAPGVTTILQVPAKPQLVQWQLEQAILAALTCPRSHEEGEGVWLDRVREDMRQTAANAAEEGTRIHAAIQRYYQGESPDGYFQEGNYHRHVRGAADAIKASCGPQRWVAEHACASLYGYGTKADLHCRNEDGISGWVLDFKGKDGDEAAFDQLTTYDEHDMQLAATAVALRMDLTAIQAGIVFVSRTHPGVARLVGVGTDELLRGWGMFRCALAYWQKQKRFRPDWAIEVTL